MGEAEYVEQDPTTPLQLPGLAPTTTAHLAKMLSSLHWVMEQASYDLPAGRATRGQIEQLVIAMEGLADLLRQHITGWPEGPSARP